ncbi:uncharacterized protein FIESC28_09320 [Fusarium coffeatum]|uniref:ATP-grasp domain-containing protein n=1 Tax=Fusarium coffeatum TaxID=231269 RepID=A0A366R0W7_9HYPO|nr:uncharacterized protein FIESC28_09320 [Fusarium coffeatum]RBR10789.1 hypothetical protein FIESC28_09320 [Fusarium coffeatum]
MQSLLVPRLANRGIPLFCRASHLARSRYAGLRSLSSKASTRVAVLYQALDPPIINGVRKPKKPGGYQDSGADIAYNLDQCDDVQVITPNSTPEPLKMATGVFLIPKKFVNNYLRAVGGFTMPRTFTASSLTEVAQSADNISYPVVAKPIRGRGSFGVKVCHNKSELLTHAEELSSNSMAFMVEEFLEGEEATVTVMPPTAEGQDYWSLPIVTRFNHQNGIASYNGVVAVTANSRVVPESETGPLHERLARECERAASLLRLAAPIRIDVRKFKDSSESAYALFDVNTKPNMTGPGRPNRDDQASLTLLAANGLGWDYNELLRRILGGLALARVLFNDSRDIFSLSSGGSGDPSAIRPFTNGPFGMEKGIILSTGSLTLPLGPGDTCPSSYTTDVYDAYTRSYCGADSYNGVIYTLNVLPTKATTFLVDIVIASCDLISGDKVILMVDGVNYAKDENGIALDSSSKYLGEPWGIPSPNGDTAFLMSSPPLRFSIPVPKSYVELKIAVCDRLDGYGDTAVMVKIRPCNDCDQSFKVDYDATTVTITTTYEATSIITQPASGTARGTISHVTYVTPSPVSTTSSSQDSTSEDITSSAVSATSTFSTSFIASTSDSPAPATTSSAPLSCNEMSHPYQAPSGSKFQVDCDSYATGGNQIGLSHKAGDLSTCIDLCATTSNCQAALLDRSQLLCYLLDGTDGPAFNNLYDMATLLSSTPSTTESSEASSSTTSPPSPQTSLSCSQMVSSIYTDKFTISCDTVSTGESIYRSAEEDSLENCLAMCDNDIRCLAINFYPYPYSNFIILNRVYIIGVHTVNSLHRCINYKASNINDIISAMVRFHIGAHIGGLPNINWSFIIARVYNSYINSYYNLA